MEWIHNTPALVMFLAGVGSGTIIAQVLIFILEIFRKKH